MRFHWNILRLWSAGHALSLAAFFGTALPGMAAECPITRWVQRQVNRPVGPGFTPSNVYRAHQSFPADWRRVAILPIAAADNGAQSNAGEETLRSAISRELGKQMAFEVVVLSPEAVKRITGRARWHADDPIPPALLAYVRDQKACQGLILPELTQYQAYGPLQIGWKMKLIDTREASVFWAFDQVFDSGVGSVATAARRFAQDHHAEVNALGDYQLILSSPSRFGEYTLSAAFSTLPSR